MDEFPFIKIEDKKYPTVIMGEDNFTGWWNKGRFDSEEERAKAYREAIEIAYSKGVRGFSMSPQNTLLQVLKNFKKEHQDIVCIANPHWQKHYYLGKESLWDQKNLIKLRATQLSLNEELKNCEWHKNSNIEDRLDEEEINSIRLDEEEYKKSLKKFHFCDFWLVGNIGTSAFILLNRFDIIKKEIELVRKSGMCPIGMCQGGGLALKGYERLDIGGTWIWINKNFVCPNLEYALKEIKKAKKPITAYKIFTNPEGFDFKKSIEFIKRIKQIKSVVVGVENGDQARGTFTNLREVWK